jgi:hypothetical protein
MTEQPVFQAAHPTIRRPSPLLPEKVKQHLWAEQVALTEETRERAIDLSKANQQGAANLLLVIALRERLVLSESRLVKAMLLPRELARPASAPRATQQEMHHQLQEDSAVLQARARRCLRVPGPFAFSQVALAARRCNRAAHCGDYPIFARYLPPRIRGALAGCDSKCSRSQRKPVRRGRTFPIAAADKYRCLPHRTAD